MSHHIKTTESGLTSSANRTVFLFYSAQWRSQKLCVEARGPGSGADPRERQRREGRGTAAPRVRWSLGGVSPPQPTRGSDVPPDSGGTS